MGNGPGAKCRKGLGSRLGLRSWAFPLSALEPLQIKCEVGRAIGYSTADMPFTKPNCLCWIIFMKWFYENRPTSERGFTTRQVFQGHRPHTHVPTAPAFRQTNRVT